MMLVKLGGSVITDKSKKYVFKEKTVGRLAKEIKNSGEKVIVVHGAGSFGHILAKKYRLDKGFINEKQIIGVAKVQADVKGLNARVVNSLINAGINPVSIPPSSVVECRNKKIEKINIDVFKKYLALGLTPVTFGDVALDRKIGFCIVSGDLLMLELARFFKPEKSIFVSNVDGVYMDKKRMDKIDEKIVRSMKRKKTKIPDVTGSMYEKVKIGLKMSKFTKTMIINGNVNNRLGDALKGRNVVGTVIE
ncbi:MAG: isopentenyl phosphate kinase family protein [Candidatus Thermoplasmatota archaeon]|nr:isopentenyl phosphate kinase family protein [Candidatus Thermoplasmatota archaeon]